MTGTEPAMAYWEWSSAGTIADVDLADPEVAWAANPAFGTRLNEEYIFGVERSSMDDEEFARERLGIFPDDDDAPQWLVWSEEQWSACSSAETGKRAEEPGWLKGTVTLAIEMRPDRSTTTIAAAGECREGGRGIEVVAHGPGSGWVVDTAVALTTDEQHPVKGVVIDTAGPAGPLIDDLVAAGVNVIPAKYADLKMATADLFDAIVEHEAVHRDRPELTASVAGASKRTSGDTWLIDRRGPVDASPINAAGLALWGHLQVDVAQPEPDFIVI